MLLIFLVGVLSAVAAGLFLTRKKPGVNPFARDMRRPAGKGDEAEGEAHETKQRLARTFSMELVPQQIDAIVIGAAAKGMVDMGLTHWRGTVA